MCADNKLKTIGVARGTPLVLCRIRWEQLACRRVDRLRAGSHVTLVADLRKRWNPQAADDSRRRRWRGEPSLATAPTGQSRGAIRRRSAEHPNQFQSSEHSGPVVRNGPTPRRACARHVSLTGKDGSVQVSMAAGYEPAWAHSDRELFFPDWQQSVLMVVSVETRPKLTVSRPRRVIPSGTAAGDVAVDTYDVMPDDRHS